MLGLIIISPRLIDCVQHFARQTVLDELEILFLSDQEKLACFSIIRKNPSRTLLYSSSNVPGSFTCNSL